MNLKVRFKNPVFILQLILSIITPVLAYMGLTVQDLTTWDSLWKVIVETVHTAFTNPYVLSMIVVSVWNALNDPTTAGLTDSALARTYDEPNPDK